MFPSLKNNAFQIMIEGKEKIQCRELVLLKRDGCKSAQTLRHGGEML